MKLAVIDTETDPFLAGRTLAPFCAGFYNGEQYIDFWGDDCVRQLFDFIDNLTEPHVIYAHNGGKFDYMFCLPYLDGDLHFIGSRIARAFRGTHEFRDSWSIIPEKLETFEQGKKEIEYWKLEKGFRETHQSEILSYQKQDCMTLYHGVAAFLKEFGDFLTIGSAAMAELRKFHTFDKAGSSYDQLFRNFYYGGRCQVFRSGIIKGAYKVYDVNSMYPHVMHSFKHPLSIAYDIGTTIGPRTTFAIITARNYGCLPVRTKQGIDFTVEHGRFWATIHEIQAGEETGSLYIEKIHSTIEHKEVGNFATFVEHFVAKKIMAEKTYGKKSMLRMFYKRVPNSCYGKFAQNPANYCDHRITHNELLGPPWTIYGTNGEWYIWQKPATRQQYYNVATAASITGASRAVLLRGLKNAIDPIYCDTDSIICKDLRNVPIHETELGAWKIEDAGSTAAIAGKKLYAIFEEEACVKQACKGVKLTPQQIVDVCRGEVIEYEQAPPSFSKDGQQHFIKRRVKKTVV